MEAVEIAAEDGVANETSLLEALGSRSGQSRYDPDTGKLFLDDKVQMQIGLVNLDDGTWTVGSIEFCTPQ